MASPFCRCGNPQACTCFAQTPRRNDVNYNPYQSSSPQSTWPNQYYPPQAVNFMPPPAFPAPPFQRNFIFQNTYPPSFDTAAPPPGLFTPRAPLADATNTGNTPAAPQRKNKRKAPGTAAAGPSRTRRRVDSSAAPAAPDTPAVFGVGPSTDAAAAAAASASESVFHPSLVNIPGVNFESLVEKEKAAASGTAATDVWYFVRGVHTAAVPTSAPEPLEWSTKRPDKEEFSHLACRFCKLDKWKVWRNVDGQTTVIRDHLKAAHHPLWSELVLLKQLKGWETMGTTHKPAPGEREEFSLPGFYERLVKWIAVDDQSIDVVDCPELRELLLFIGSELEDGDIPHRTKLAQLIATRFQVEYEEMIREIQNSISRVSLTHDIWTRKNLDAHLAITGHYIVRGPDGRLVLKSRLLAFRRMEGSHTGENIGKVFVQVMKEIGCLHKMGMITCDNAGNNNTGMDQICDELTRIGIPFDADGNRIRCFPHVVNIAVQTALKELCELPAYQPDIVLDDNGNIIPQSLRDNIQYWNALASNPVAEARSLVTACRASGQRRDNFETTIKDGNAEGGFGDPPEQPGDPPQKTLRVVGLLKDVETRWSATFLMIDRLLEQYLAVDKFLADPKQSEISWRVLSKTSLKVLDDIRRFLQVPHLVQEIVSGQNTPTLSFVLPLYEQLIVMLKDLAKELDELSIGINASIRKLEEYLSMSRRTKIYSLAMVLNPTIKLQWLRENWSVEDAQGAKNALRGAMLEYRKEHRLQGNGQPEIQVPPTTSRRPVNPPTASNSAQAVSSGLTRLRRLAKTISEPTLDGPSQPPTPATSTEQERAEAERRAVLEDERIVDDEITHYEAEGILTESDPEFAHFDLLLFWERREHRFPYMFRVALDVLPAQASAVPCERVFSSSKETDSERRNSLSPRMIEMLQILKFIYRQERIHFCGDLVATEAELSVIDIDPEVVDALLTADRTEELEELINSSYDNSPAASQ